MRKLLRQKGSGHLYVWSPQLAARDDMEEVEVQQPTAKVEEQPEPVEQAQEPEAHKLAQKLFKRKRGGGMQDDVGATDELSIKLN